MRPRSLAILALLVVALAAFLWLGRDLPSSDELAARAKKVLALEADEIERLEIEWEDRTVVLERAPASAGEADEAERDWMLVQPLEARADTTLVDGVVRRLVALEKERTLEDVARSDVGLAEPRGRVRLEAAGSDYVLEIGADVPASSSMTLAVEGEDAVHVVGASIWPELTKQPDEWRDKSLFTATRGDIERISLETDGDRVLLARRGDDFWLESPVTDRADRTLVNALLSTITGLRAESFVEPAELVEGSDPLSAPRGTLEVVLSGSELPLEIEVGASQSEIEGEDEDAALFLRVDGQTVTSKAALLEHLERSPAEWRSKDLVTGEVYELARLEIEDGSGTTELSRADSDWLRDGEVVDYGTATDLLYEISGGSAERVVDAAEVGELGQPALTFRLIPEVEEEGTEPQPEVLELFEPWGDETPARVSSREAVLLLSTETANALAGKLAAVRAAEAQPRSEAAEAGEAAEGETDP